MRNFVIFYLGSVRKKGSQQEKEKTKTKHGTRHSPWENWNQKNCFVHFVLPKDISSSFPSKFKTFIWFLLFLKKIRKKKVFIFVIFICSSLPSFLSSFLFFVFFSHLLNKVSNAEVFSRVTGFRWSDCLLKILEMKKNWEHKKKGRNFKKNFFFIYVGVIVIVCWSS